MDEAHDRRPAMAAAATTGVLYGTSYVATAVALHSFSPLAAAAWRGILPAAALGLALVWRRVRRRPIEPARRGWAWFWRLASLGLLGGAIFIVAINVAVATAGAAIASFVAGLYSVVAAVLAPLVLGERLGRGPVVGFVVALLGTALLAELQPSGTSPGGIAAGLLAALSFGLYLVLSRRWSGPWHLAPIEVTLSALVCTALAVVGIEIVSGSASLVPASIRLDALLGLLWLAGPVAVGAQLLIQFAVGRIDARLSAAFLLLNPPTATVAAWLLLGESLRPVQLLGGALVLTGIGLASGLSRPVRAAIMWRSGQGPAGT